MNLSKNKPYLHLSIALGILGLECYLKITAFRLSWKADVSLPSLKSNQILFLYFSPFSFFTFTVYTVIFNPYIHSICNTSHINMAFLFKKLEKGTSGIWAPNFVIISKRCTTLLNWTNQTKNTGRDRLGFWSPHCRFRIPQKNSRIPYSTCRSFPDSEIRITIGQSIALFRLYVLFPQRSKGNLTLCLFLCADHVCTWIRWKLKETVLESIYTWPALENKTYKLKRSIVTYHLDTQQWPAFRCRKLKISLK